MRYLDLTSIKKQLTIDEWFESDNDYLESLGDTAEEYIEQLVNKSLDDLAANNGGELPNPLRQAALIYTNYLYSCERGSSGQDIPIPEAINLIVKLYRSYL